MINQVMGPAEAQLSPEKEQEIATRILKRAELAQMTRQLKMKLGKVPTSRESSPVKVRKRRGNDGCDIEIREAMAKVSPVKKEYIKANTSDQEDETDEKGSPVKQMKRWDSSPVAPPASSSSAIQVPEELRVESDTPTTPRRVRANHQTVPPAMRSGSSGVELNSRMMAMTTTPKSGPQGKKFGTGENDVGADLLMYLATSPYTSASSQQQTGVPSTPRNYVSHQAGLDDSHDAIRFSHMKPHASSPQSTFKVPSHSTRRGSYSQGQSAHFRGSSSELLMDSPAIYMAASSSPQKRRQLAVQEPTNVPTTPSRELRSSSHLFKTPNFNIGDYVHALFSPSPRVTSSATSRPASIQETRLPKR